MGIPHVNKHADPFSEWWDKSLKCFAPSVLELRDLLWQGQKAKWRKETTLLREDWDKVAPEIPNQALLVEWKLADRGSMLGLIYPGSHGLKFRFPRLLIAILCWCLLFIVSVDSWHFSLPGSLKFCCACLSHLWSVFLCFFACGDHYLLLILRSSCFVSLLRHLLLTLLIFFPWCGRLYFTKMATVFLLTWFPINEKKWSLWLCLLLGLDSLCDSGLDWQSGRAVIFARLGYKRWQAFSCFLRTFAVEPQVTI